MTTVNEPHKPPVEIERLRATWLQVLSSLIQTVQSWAKESDWSVRQIEKNMEDSEIGTYVAPALLLQKETIRVLLEPIARKSPGAEGVVDLYLMPAYDDIASLYFCNGDWQLHYMFPSTLTVGDIRDTPPMQLSKEIF